MLTVLTVGIACAPEYGNSELLAPASVRAEAPAPKATAVASKSKRVTTLAAAQSAAAAKPAAATTSSSARPSGSSPLYAALGSEDDGADGARPGSPAVVDAVVRSRDWDLGKEGLALTGAPPHTIPNPGVVVL